MVPIQKFVRSRVFDRSLERLGLVMFTVDSELNGFGDDGAFATTWWGFLRAPR